MSYARYRTEAVQDVFGKICDLVNTFKLTPPYFLTHGQSKSPGEETGDGSRGPNC